MPLAAILIPLIVKEGIPAAIKIWQILANKTELTPEMIDQLLAVETDSARHFANAITNALNKPA